MVRCAAMIRAIHASNDRFRRSWPSLFAAAYGFGMLSSLAACGGALPPDVQPRAQPDAQAAQPPAVRQVSLAEVGLDPDKLDRNADPCDDFYRFSCGNWLDHTEIPKDKPHYGTFNIISDRNEAILHDILERAAREPKTTNDPVLKKLGSYYATCMDESAIERAGTSAVAELFELTRGVKDERSWLSAIAQLQLVGVDVVFDLGPVQDKKDATQMIAQIDQGGLGLPDRDYYLQNDERTLSLRKAYEAHLTRLFVLSGKTQAAAKRAAADALAIETAIAKTHKTRVELRDEQGTYNRIDRAGLAEHAKLPWDAYFKALGAPDIQAINTVSVPYVEGFAVLAKSESAKPTSWARFRNYFDARILHALSPYLSKRFVDEAFELTRVLVGQKEQRARWKRCISYTDKSLGELLAQPYVDAAFAGESKLAAQNMTQGIAHAFERNLASVTWMDDATKQKAREKLAVMLSLIGYPDRFRTYDYRIDRKNFAATQLEALRFESRYQLGRIGKPVDKREWQMTPQTVNAYYDPQLNEMCFPAGILQPPFYDVKSAVPVNLGAMGMIVGHELTHGFDDQGAQYDGTGNLSGWWPEHVTQAFTQRTQCVADYYSAYEPLPGLKLNGQLTLGENIADIGGVKLAFAAYRELRHGVNAAKDMQVAEGFSEQQQFFLAVGQAWCTKTTEELERMRVLVDPHSSPQFRVNGSLSNLPEFAEAFQCKPGSKMRPATSCTVW